MAQPGMGYQNWAMITIECLQKHYIKPCLLHQVHIRVIPEIPIPEEGNGKELHRLHYVCSQHLWALKTMGFDPSGPFAGSLIKMKLKQSTMFEWQKHTQENLDVPHYTVILEFINLPARASKMVLHECPKHLSQTVPSNNSTPIRTTYVEKVDTTCGVGKHPFNVCRKLKFLLPKQLMDLIRKHQLCYMYNCLQSGHYTKQCASDRKC